MVNVQSIDPTGADLGAWHRAYLAAHRVDDPGEPEWLLEEVRAKARPGQDEVSDVLLARDDAGDVLGVAYLSMPTSDNQHLLLIEHLAVVPEARRQGVGTGLLQAAAATARRHGRSTLLLEVLAPGSRDHNLPGDVAARSWGFAVASRDQRRTLTLPLPGAVADHVRSAIGSRADAYDVVTWCGSAPAPLLEDRALIQQRMSTDTPLGDIDWRAEAWDGARFRRFEESVSAMGRQSWTAGAVERTTGRLVAATWILAHPNQPTQAWQWDTLVLPEHRGHRLGLATKLANIERLQQDRPTTRHVSTGNAADNAAMIAVNDALGFRVTGFWREYQRRL
jgi:GNAT superfamily N-acetyltransferase